MSIRIASVALGALIVEIVIGAATVWTQSSQGWNSAFITIHLALGALIWSSLVALTTVAEA